MCQAVPCLLFSIVSLNPDLGLNPRLVSTRNSGKFLTFLSLSSPGGSDSKESACNAGDQG